MKSEIDPIGDFRRINDIAPSREWTAVIKAYDTLRTQLKSVEADAAVMREAFAWLEEYFRVNIDGGGRHSCPWCYHKKEDVEQWAQIEHAPECIIGKALCRDTFLNPTTDKKG